MVILTSGHSTCKMIRTWTSVTTVIQNGDFNDVGFDNNSSTSKRWVLFQDQKKDLCALSQVVIGDNNIKALYAWSQCSEKYQVLFISEVRISYIGK